MPALTVPDSTQDDPPNLSSRSLANPYPRPSPPRPQRIPPDMVYSHTHFDPNGAPSYHDRAHPPLFSSHFSSSPPSSSMFNYFALPHATANWQPHVQFLHHNPYPPPQPPQVVHKVWILDCRSCGTFLTNRGMKAVLLLRPNVSLFSTDALPVNCSAYSTNPDALRPPPCRPLTASPGPRTCECLTQTLCCHTCGAAVGYMIVIPCARCTSSISATNRATNGHRFVFHSSEIVASERYHIPDEPGVLPFEHPSPPPPPSSPPPLAPAYPATFHYPDSSAHRRSAPSLVTRTSPSPGSDYHSAESLDLESSFSSSPSLTTSVPPTSPRPPPPNARNPGSQAPPDARAEICARKLKAGDVLYWHHLAKHGEIPGVQEDSRARIPNRGVARFFER